MSVFIAPSSSLRSIFLIGIPHLGNLYNQTKKTEGERQDLGCGVITIRKHTKNQIFAWLEYLASRL